jgi:hypothetical protein
MVVDAPQQEPVKTTEGKAYSVNNVVTEEQEDDVMPATQPTVTEDESVTDPVETVVVPTPAPGASRQGQVSPYISSQ